MEPVAFNLEKNLRAGQDLLRALNGDIREVAIALAYLAMVIAIVGGLIARDHGAGLKAAARSMVCLILFDAYDGIFMAAVRASDTLSYYLREQSSYGESLARVMNSAGQFLHSQDGIFDMVTGLIKGAYLAETNLFTHALVLYCTLFVVHFTLVILNFLYVLGPFMIVGGVFGQGSTLHAWARSLFQVLLWPVFPCFILLVNSYFSSNVAVAADNVSQSMSTNVILSGMVILTPIVVAMLMSHGGLTAMGALAWGAALGMGSRVLKMGAGAMAGGSFGIAAGSALSGSAASVAGTSNASKMLSGRPDDARTAMFPISAKPPQLPPPSSFVGPEGAAQWLRWANPPPKIPRVKRPAEARNRDGKCITIPSAVLRGPTSERRSSHGS